MNEPRDPAAGSKYIGSFRWKVFQTFEDPDFSENPAWARLISVVVMVTILVSCTTFILESEACEPTSFLPAHPTLFITNFIEVVSVVIFSMCAHGLGLRMKLDAARRLTAQKGVSACNTLP